MTVGDRVRNVTPILTDEGNLKSEGNSGTVIGHRGSRVLVAWDLNGYAAEYSETDAQTLAVKNRDLRQR